ncbi:phage tail protein [Pseudoduganella sp. GCM10020061]|uniref:phage tail protein n=1 Tax=Pseudoduganella sp. GCM10020061 TaxID=3317345 RepID=UPI0036404250
MSDPFIGEIKIYPFNRVPRGWAPCQGQLLPINQNQALYSLLGNVYGGDGRTTFALPDLRGRVAIHVSNTIPLGAMQGEETHTLTVNEMPQHAHQVFASEATASSPDTAGGSWASAESMCYNPPTTVVPMNPAAIATAGGSQPHPNMQPYLAMAFCIATQGIYPPRN